MYTCESVLQKNVTVTKMLQTAKCTKHPGFKGLSLWCGYRTRWDYSYGFDLNHICLLLIDWRVALSQNFSKSSHQDEVVLKMFGFVSVIWKHIVYSMWRVLQITMCCGNSTFWGSLILVRKLHPILWCT